MHKIIKSNIILFIAILILIPAVAQSQIENMSSPLKFNTYDNQQISFKPSHSYDETLNVKINSDTTTQIQNEQQICINPLNPQNVVAVWRDFRLGYRRVGVGVSFDGGFTWSDALFPAHGYPWHTDPGLTVDVNGNFYAVILAYVDDQSHSSFEIFKSSDGGLTWQGPYLAIDSGWEYFEDKELIACDRAPDSPYQGNLYIVWKRFYDEYVQLLRSEDGGENWSDVIEISDYSIRQWAVPVVGAGGTLYVPWVGWNAIWMDRSFNAGETWGQDYLLTEVYSYVEYLHGNIKSYSYPAMDSDISGGENHGNLYVAYMDKPIYADEYDFDIFFRKSTDHGLTWSERIRVNDDEIYNGCDQFHPWLVVDNFGVITIMFYDRRNDPQDNLSYDIYLTQSYDAGETWTENYRVTTESSDPGEELILAGKIGEYSGLSVVDGFANLAWTDFRDGNQDTYSARIRTYLTDIMDSDRLPSEISILNNYPNPFNQSTTITYTINSNSHVVLDIFDIQGRKISNLINETVIAGEHKYILNANDLSSGIYFYKLQAGEISTTSKMTLIK